MSGIRRRGAPIAAMIVALLALAACDMHSTPLWGPNSPRNGGNEVVDPVTGVPIPGFPQPSGTL
jgi:hypothetical protein